MNRAVELMTVDDMLNAIGLAGVLLYFFIPTIVFILGFYIYNRHKKKKEIENRQKMSLKKNEDKQKEEVKESKVNDTNSTVNKNINNTDKPENIEKFRSLTLEFDETGHVKDTK